MPPTLQIEDAVAVVDLGDDENRFSIDWLSTVESILDDVLESEAQSLITIGTGKFYSNGLDLKWLMTHSDQLASYSQRAQELIGRILVFPMPTIAALPGHAFGAGAMLALAHDFRVMREDRGFFCLPEVDIRIPFTPGMTALILSKVTPQTATYTMTTGRRVGGTEAESLGIVDRTSSEANLLGDAFELALPLKGKDRPTLGAIKESMYATAVAALSSKTSVSL